MTYPYKRDLLQFINALHHCTTFSGITDFHVHNNEHLPELRTIYRWQKELNGVLEYYPCIDFTALGLVHFHLFIKEPSSEVMQWPFVLEMHWLVRDIGERLLYVHGLVPLDKIEIFKKSVDEKALLLFTSNGRQCIQDLLQALDHQGRLNKDMKQSIQMPSIESKNKLAEISKCPLIIPVIFEGHGKRLSLDTLWQAVRARLAEGVWQFILNGKRRLIINGKAYVKKAFTVMAELGLFSQVRIRYSAFLNEALEVFLVLDSSDLNRVLDSVQSSSLIVEVYPGLEGKHLLRLIGNHHLIYSLMSLSLPSGSSWYFLDKTKSIEARFRYEELFDAKTLKWNFPIEAKEVRA